MVSRALLFLAVKQIQRDVDDHILLAADHPPFAQLDENIHRAEAIARRRRFAVAQEAGVDPGVAQRQRFALL